MMQRVMKADGEVEDHSTWRLLTPEECTSEALHEKQEKFPHPDKEQPC